jgi:diguanylate cyclase (GGDEF)-like protein
MSSIRRLIPSRAILAVALALSAGSIWVIVGLEQRADTGRKAQLTLSGVQSQVNVLQGLPWRTSRAAGGSPSLAKSWMQKTEREIQRSLADLARRVPASTLADLRQPLLTNFALLERIRVFSAANKFMQAGELADQATRSQDRVLQALDSEGVRYEARASRAVSEAEAFTAATIVLLLGAFTFFYRRSSRAGALAALLAEKNRCLLEDSRVEALTDHLTGLGNRRALLGDLELQLHPDNSQTACILVMFDLDGFKQYNDTYGHPAGDALLHRLATRLRGELGDAATAYRMGGDEFCVLAEVDPADGHALAQKAAAALSDQGEGFHVGCSYGIVQLPLETADPAEAMRLADDRMYDAKASVRTSARGQSTAVLLKVLHERSNELGHHIDDVAKLAGLVAEQLGLSQADQHAIRTAAQLHDVGKAAIPDTILDKPGPLDEAEWELMRCHTLIGERIVSAAPALASTAELIRASHERFDGHGYPDRLQGPQIPLGARIIAVCDAFDAMISDRPYQAEVSISEAHEELRRCSGSQFDPQVVEAFCAVTNASASTIVSQAA